MEFYKGQVPWNKGKKTPAHVRAKQSARAKEMNRVPPSKKGKKDSFETVLRKRASAQRGQKNNKWKGGISSLNHLIRNCYEYRQWRSDVFTRDDYACVICLVRSGNGKAVYIEADHYPVMFYQIRERNNIQSLDEARACSEFWNINNGRTLCKSCHNKTKPGRRKET